jgi:hypothetical protein
MGAMTIDSELATAQQAIELPEVQEMARRLSAYGLGVFMPHMHDSVGEMLPLPEGIVQVEGDDLRAEFLPAEQVIDTPEKQFVTVGWRWSAETKSMSGTTHCPILRDAKGNPYHPGPRRTN